MGGQRRPSKEESEDQISPEQEKSTTGIPGRRADQARRSCERKKEEREESRSTRAWAEEGKGAVR